jgi:hypothetical protein
MRQSEYTPQAPEYCQRRSKQALSINEAAIFSPTPCLRRVRTAGAGNRNRSTCNVQERSDAWRPANAVRAWDTTERKPAQFPAHFEHTDLDFGTMSYNWNRVEAMSYIVPA